MKRKDGMAATCRERQAQLAVIHWGIDGGLVVWPCRASSVAVASKVAALDIAIGRSLQRCVVTLSFASQTAAASQ
jgi:hypothetical protein